MHAEAAAVVEVEPAYERLCSEDGPPDGNRNGDSGRHLTEDPTPTDEAHAAHRFGQHDGDGQRPGHCSSAGFVGFECVDEPGEVGELSGRHGQ